MPLSNLNKCKISTLVFLLWKCMELHVSLNTSVIFEVRNCIHLNSITVWSLLQVWEIFTLLCNNRYGYYLPLKNINVQPKKSIDYNIFKRLRHEGNSNCQCEANTGKQENNRNNLMQTRYGKRTSQKANFTQWLLLNWHSKYVIFRSIDTIMNYDIININITLPFSIQIGGS